MELIKYEPVTVIETKDSTYFTTAPIEAVAAAKKRNESITVGGTTLDPFEIKRIYIDEYGLSTLTQSQYQRLTSRKKEFKQNLGREPRPTEIQKMIAKLS